MLKVYFGEWGNGRLQRLAYLGYYLLLMVIAAAIILGTIFAIGATTKLMGGDVAATQAMLMEHFGIFAIVGIVILLIAIVLGQINIMAKRIRDMGLPAVWTIVGIIAVSMILNILFPAQVVEVSTAVVKTAESTAAAATTQTTASPIVQLFDMVVFLCLLFIPSDAFRKNS
jgi:uncharacterized membrane protein YhaH (DUF805 family)